MSQSTLHWKCFLKLCRSSCMIGVLLIMFLCPHTVDATPIYYIGIGNSTAHDPEGKAADKLKNTLAKAAQATGQQFVPKILHPEKDANGDTVEVGKERITQALQEIVPKLKEGDLVVFYYIGHGSTLDEQEGTEDAPGDQAKTTGDEAFGASGNMMLDDELASLMDSISDTIPKVVIADTCYSGGWVGGANDLDRAAMSNLLYLLSTPEDQRDPGLYEYAAPLSEAFLTDPATGKPKGDKNKDGKVTLGEWLNYADEARRAAGYGSGGCGFTPWANSNPNDYVIFPEPSSLAILLAGMTCMATRRRTVPR